MPDDIGDEKNTIATCIFNEVDGNQERHIDFEFEGFSPIEMNLTGSGERSYCGFHYVAPDDLPATHAELEQQVAESGIQIINDLDPANNRIVEGNLRRFLEREIDETNRGPDYLVIDNFADQFELDISDLNAAKAEAENVTVLGCNSEGSTSRGARCDAVTWMAGLGGDGDDNPSLRKIYNSVDRFIPTLNGVSSSDGGENSLRIDKQEVVVSRQNGYSGKAQ